MNDLHREIIDHAIQQMEWSAKSRTVWTADFIEEVVVSLKALRKSEADLRAALAAVIKQRDGYRSALERIANEDYRGNRRKESQIAFDALAAADASRTAMRKGDTNGK